MAKVSDNDILDKYVDWSQDPTNNLPYSGRAVQKFIKEQLDGKAGVFYYDSTNNRYLVFTDTFARDEYIANPNQTELIIGTFDAPFNYTAEIDLISPSYNAVFLGSIGNYIDFTFDIKNKQGDSTGENVTISYTFIRNSNKKVIKETRRYGEDVHFNIDKYIGEGTNTIIVGVTGQNTLAATTVAITYQVINLLLSDETNISKVYNLTNGEQVMEVSFTVSGYGTKVVEWYIDGELLEFIKSEDEVVDVSATRTKYITLSNLQQGRHTLQIRAYTLVNGDKFYTDTLYRDIIVYTNTGNDLIIGISTTIPRKYGVLGANDSVAIYDMVQYLPYTLKFATYSPLNLSSSEVSIFIDNELKGVVNSKNNITNEFSIVSTTSGDKTLVLSSNGVSYTIPIKVEKTSMNIEEITESLVLDFNAIGKNNDSTNKGDWSYGDYVGTLSGFDWTNVSGWVNGRLEMNAGSSFGINIKPLSNEPTKTGKTIEIEWATKNVTNDDAIICDLRNESGVGILITATKVSMKSADGVVVETEYKSEENVRVGFVINRSENTANKRLSFIYANGIVSRGEKWAENDSYSSDKELLFTATSEAEISLKSIRIYDIALTSDQMLNNYTLYRDTIDEMIEVYDRNDVYIDGTTIFSPDKMMGRLPVMIVTGDIPTLENTSDKDTQIIVDIDYYNMQDTSRSFRMVGAAMRPQGTSSMGYPKKNFRIYTKKVDGTILYDSNGNVVNDKLYSFKGKAQPVDCWCLKADYAESSGTHNTGIARLWNDALLNAQVDGEYVCRTGAQKAAIAVNYEYDVRTTIDGFPILLFYHQTVDDDLIFIGKYNFNNDKSTESVFGFKNIPNFDNSKMQCWEVLNNGNPLALFTTMDGFDENWSEAFESRYPDTKTPNTSDLKAFCQWMVNVTQEDFATQKWEHLNIYMMAAYWCYLMRHAGADQFVKNAMFTSEDGQHFYYILYDNDTINGLINTGRLRIKPTDNRQTVDESGAYVFAGHDSRLWNLLEADKEFIDIVSAVDNALYSAGISYANTIRVFDEEQADKWVEKVYNQDAQYKYVGPYVEKGIDNLFMLQGKRDLHRKWWLAKRFSIYDAKYVSGTYKSQAVELKCINGTPAGQTFTITAGYPIDYGFGINNVPREFGISLNIGETHTFTTREVVNLGDPIRIYGAPNIAGIDLSPMAQQLAVITIANVYDEALGTKLTKLIVGRNGTINNEVTEISGLKQATALEELDVQGMKKIISLDLSNHAYFKSLKAFGSGISSITFAKGSPLTNLELPSTMRVLSLEQLPYLTINKLLLEDVSNIQDINIISCPNLSQSFSFVYDWYKSKNSANKVCSLVMDNIIWENVDSAQLLDLFKLKTDGGELDLKGRISIPNATLTLVRTINNLFGGSAFFPTSELYFEVPPTIELSSDKESILEGENIQFSYELYPALEGKITYSLTKGRSGCSINPTTGLLTTSEKAVDTSDIIARVTFVSNDGKVNIYDEKSVQVVRRTYPQGVELIGNSNLIQNDTFLLVWDNETNGSFSVDWSISSGVDGNYAILSYSNNECKLERESIPNDTISGTLTAKIRRNFDNAILETISIPISHEIYWPESAYIDGEENPKNNNVYVSVIDTNGVTGEFDFSWELSGDILSYFELEVDAQNNAVLNEIEPPISKINGVLNLTIRKTYNNETILSIDKPLVALIPGVVINYKDNAPIQALMYSKGFVANELYSLKEEIEAITASNLQTGTSATTSIFYAVRNNITHFEEFEYFTGVTYVPAHCFSYLSKMTSIKLPNTITNIRNNAFGVNTSTNAGIRSIEIPEGVTTIGNSAFIGCDALKTATFPSTLTSIGNNTFEGCTNLQSVILKEGVTSIGNSAFKSCTNLAEFSIPSTLSSIGTNIFESCHNLYIAVNSNNQKYASMDGVLFNKNYTSLYKYAKGNKEKSYIIPDGVTTLEQYSFQYSPLEEVTLPSSLKTIAAYSFSGATSLAKITSNALSAPSTTSTSFGNSDTTYTGRNNYSSGTNEIFIQNNSTGYESSYWLDPLQNASKSGFSIHGKFVILSNRSDAQFSVKYTTLSGSSKTITLGVGTSYLSDIKYNTSVVVTAPSISGSIWDSESVTITYSNTNNSVTLNAYIYPTSVAISGNSSIEGGKSATYVANLTPTNVDVDLTYEWSISGSTNAQISSTNGNQCVVATTNPTEDTTSTLTCVVKSVDGKVTVQDTHGITITPKEYYIEATYNVESTSSATQLIYANIGVSYIKSMKIDGVSVTPVLKYTFNTTGEHKVIIVLKQVLSHLFFHAKQLKKVDFSNCYTEEWTYIGSMFGSCSSLTQIIWGDCRFKNATDVSGMFSICSSLTSIDLTPLQGAPITNASSMFSGCSKLTSINITPLQGAPITNVSSMFSGCSKLTSINITPLQGAPITNASSMFSGCSSLTSINITPLSDAPITNASSMFYGCSKLTSINITPLQGAPITNVSSMFSGCSSLTSINITPLQGAPITNVSSMFYGCSKLTLIDLTPLQGAQITEMKEMLRNCSSLTSIDLTPLQGAPITTLYYAFAGCSALTSINLTPLNGAPITNTSLTFLSCSKLSSIHLPISREQITYIRSMFDGCSSLTEIDLTPLSNQTKITDITSMFEDCSSLTEIDLTPLSDSSITNTKYLFSGCKNLSTIYCGWKTAPTTDSSSFGVSQYLYTGRNTYSTGQNKLYVPADSTGYDASYWLDPLCNSTKCGFTLSKTL